MQQGASSKQQRARSKDQVWGQADHWDAASSKQQAHYLLLRVRVHPSMGTHAPGHDPAAIQAGSWSSYSFLNRKFILVTAKSINCNTQLIICNKQFIICNAKFIIFNRQFIIRNTKFIIFNAKLTGAWAEPPPSLLKLENQYFSIGNQDSWQQIRILQ